MKLLLSVCALLCLYVIGAYGAAQRQGLFTTSQVQIVSAEIDTSAGYALTFVEQPATFANDGVAEFTVVVNVTYTGNFPEGASGAVTIGFSGPGVFVAARCAAELGVLAPEYGRAAGVVTYRTSEAIRFTAAGTYTASVGFVKYNLYQPIVTRTFTFVVSAAYTIPTIDRPTLSSIVLPAVQNDLPPQFNLSLNQADTYNVQAYFVSSSAPQGVAWRTQCTTNANGVCFADSWDSFQATVGGWCDNVYDGFDVNSVDFQENVPLTLRSLTILRGSDPLTFSGPPAQNALTVTRGDDDSTPPTCTAITFDATTLNTTDDHLLSVTLACGDGAGGSGIRATGAFLRLSTATTSIDLLGRGTGVGAPALTFNVDVTQYQAGTLSVVGVWAVDGAGNGVLYGSCGSAQNSADYGTVCGNSSSNTIVASLYVLLVCIIAVFFSF